MSRCTTVLVALLCSASAACLVVPAEPVDPAPELGTTMRLRLYVATHLGVGVPREIRVMIETLQGGLLRSSEAASLLSASCEADACEVVRAGERAQIIPKAPGRLRLSVRARARSSGDSLEALEATEELEVAPTRLAIRFRAGVSLGATQAATPGARIVWSSSVEDARDTLNGFASTALSEEPTELRVVEGDAVVERLDEPALTSSSHAITFGAPGTVELLASTGRLMRTVRVDVIGLEDAEAIEVRRLPRYETGGNFDVLDPRWLSDAPLLTLLDLRYPDESASLMVFFRDAKGRLAAGGAIGASTDFGSVVTTQMPDSDSTGGSLLRVLPRSLGASTIRIAVGEAVASIRAEVR